jgi:hypothetical protein
MDEIKILANEIEQDKKRIEEMTDEINRKIDELNQLRLKNYSSHIHLRFHIDNMNNKKLKRTVELIQNAFGINLNIIRSSFSIIKRAEYMDMKGVLCGIWNFSVDKYGIEIWFWDALTEEHCKNDLNKIINIIKQINDTPDSYVGLSGHHNLKIPEIENSGLRILNLGV